MLSVGVTGSFGSGKTTVTKMLASHGAKVLNADTITHQLLKRRGPCFTLIVRKFGKKILTKGRINRRTLGRIVFEDTKKLKSLERIIHPYVVGEIKSQLRQLAQNQHCHVVAVDVPLLFETGLDRLLDKVIVVKTKRTLQIQRLRKRTGLSRRDIMKRIEVQIPIRHKMRLADFVIDNSGSLSQTQSQVQRLWRNIKNIS